MSKLRKLFSFFKGLLFPSFREAEIEKEYQQRLSEFQIKSCLGLNILVIFSTFVCLMMSISQERPFSSLKLDLFLTGLYICCLLIYWKFPSKHYIFIFIVIIFHDIMQTWKMSKSKTPTNYFYIIGNLWGVIEIFILMALRMNKAKFLCLILIISIKAYFFQVSLLIHILSFILVFCFVHEAVIRNIVKELIHTRNLNKKFESLVSEHFLNLLIIVSDNFSDVLYQNFASIDFFNSRQELKEEILVEIQNQFESTSRLGVSFTESQNISDISYREKTLSKSSTFFENKFEKHYKNYHISAKRIYWDDQSAIMIILDDVSLKQSVESLKRMDEYKDKVIASISHELRTPLNGILGMLEAALENSACQKVQEYLKNCKSCGKLLLHFVNSILDLNQIKAEKMTLNKDWVSLSGITQELKAIYSYTAASKNLEFKISIDNKIPNLIYTDKLRLVQILINLITNAFKFTKEGGVVEIKISEQDKKICFSVEDNGIGIKEQDLEKIFKAFGRISQNDKNVNSQGVGLGLFISNEIVKILNEHKNEFIHVESQEGQGSKFFFFIENFYSLEENDVSGLVFNEEKEFSFENSFYDDSRTETPSHRDLIKKIESNSHKLKKSKFTQASTIDGGKVETKTKLTKPRCLVVDDNSFNLLTVSRLLNKLDLDVVTAMSGEQAIEVLTKNNFDLVLMDIQMPILDGVETTKLIKAKIESKIISEVPIIALTANGERSKSAYLEAGMVDLILKPVHLEELRKKIEQWAL